LPNRPRTPTLLACALCLPGALLIVATTAMLAGLPFGADPLWSVEPMTLSEAAALRDNGEVVRLIELGEDVNGKSTVRPDILTGHSLVLTPIEAAVAAERADMVELLLEQGARMDAALWIRLMCFSASVGADDVRALLEPRRPEGSVENCDRVETRW
jgi:hypothetical protein